MTFFYKFDYWGVDVGSLSIRALWTACERPHIVRDDWCWFVFAGPFMVSNHRGTYF